MGSISLEELLPEYFGNPHDSVPIGSVQFPIESAVMRTGFKPSSSETPVFEGETPVTVRFLERLWRYKQLPDPSTEWKSRRWRLELRLKVENAGTLKPGHVAVIAQQPYSNLWIQRPFFNMYSKKGELDRKRLKVPELAKNEPIEWLERNIKYDPWEKNRYFVAGISQPRGFLRDDPKNAAEGFVLGACADFDAMVAKLWESPEIKHLLVLTREGRLQFWREDKVDKPPRLYPTVKEECESMMGFAIHQALAGPARNSEEWIGEPVSKLVDWIYCGHLNNRNRQVRSKQESQLGKIERIMT